MKKLSLLIVSIMMVILTTLVIGVCFCYINPTKTNLFLICMISLAGYLTSYIYFLSYKEQKS